MNKESRTKNSIRNAILSVIFQAINIVCSFIVRTIFIKQLSASYLGISGLFTNILSLLSLADLGFDTAILYSLYRPIAKNDKNKISALMNYFKKIYYVIGIFVFLFGIILLPFLDSIINLETPIENIKLYYILYLLNSSLTYFLANRVAIINADQKMYVVKNIAFVFSIIQTIFQCIVLIIYKNFILYLSVQIICTLLKNITGAIVSKKMYPFLSKNKTSLLKEEKKEIFDNTKAFMFYRIGGVILNNTDNIIISSLVLTEFVGYYSNYTIIISAITTMITMFFNAMIASIGNLNVNGSLETKKKVLSRIKFLCVWIYGVCSICLLSLLNDFIGIMWGEEYMMSLIIPLAAIINFLICGLLHPFRLFRETTSAFKDLKYIYIYTSVLNLIFSWFLGIMLPSSELKLFGIIIATAVARLMTNFWLEPKKIINIVFKESSRSYFKESMLDILKITVIGIVVVFLMNKIVVTSWLLMILKAIICFCFTNLIFLIATFKSEDFIYFKDLICQIISKVFCRCKEGI